MPQADDLLCPECHHSLGLHKYFYGVCDAPLGGTFVQSRCECPVTLHELFKKQREKLTKIESIEAKFKAISEELEDSHKQMAAGTEEVIEARKLVEAANKRFADFKDKFASIKDISEEAKLIESNRFANAYKIKMHELLDQILDIVVEETTNDNPN